MAIKHLLAETTVNIKRIRQIFSHTKFKAYSS